MADVINLQQDALSVFSEFLSEHRDQIKDIIILVDLKYEDEDLEECLLIHNQVDVRLMCYMKEVLDQCIKELISGDFEDIE